MIDLINSNWTVSNSSHRLYNQNIFILMKISYSGEDFIIYTSDYNQNQHRFGGAVYVDTCTELGIYPSGTQMGASIDDINRKVEAEVNSKLDSMVVNALQVHCSSMEENIIQQTVIRLTESVVERLKEFSKKQQEQFISELENI